MKRSSDLDDWPAHVRAVLAVVGCALAGRRLSPEILRELASELDTTIPGHAVTIAHRSGEVAGRAGNRYDITIEGARISGGWSFRSGGLERLARASAAVGSGRLANREARAGGLPADGGSSE